MPTPAPIIELPPYPPIEPTPTLNALATSNYQVFAADNSLIPEVYGRARVFGKLFFVAVAESPEQAAGISLRERLVEDAGTTIISGTAYPYSRNTDDFRSDISPKLVIEQSAVAVDFGETLNVRYTFDEDVYGFDADSLWVTGKGAHYWFDITDFVGSPGDRVYTFKARAKDRAGLVRTRFYYNPMQITYGDARTVGVGTVAIGPLIIIGGVSPIVYEAIIDAGKEQDTTPSNDPDIPDVVPGEIALPVYPGTPLAESASDYLYLGFSFCLGEVNAIEKVFIDGIDIAHSGTGFLSIAGHGIEIFTGKAVQEPSALLREANVDYEDNLSEIAYVALKIPKGATRGFPRVEAIIQGRKVLDPRNGEIAYSANPTLCFLDFISRYTDWAWLKGSFVEAANFNDTELGAGAQKQREIGLALETAQPVQSIAKLFRTYMGCFLTWEGGVVRVIPDRIESMEVRTFSADDIVDQSLTLRKKGMRQFPTVVQVTYTDSTEDIWREAVQQAEAFDVPARRYSKVSLPGIHRPAQAKREAIERLNWFLSDLEGSVQVFDEGLEIQLGAVIEINHPLGLANKRFRVTRMALVNDNWVFNIIEYNDSIYSTDVDEGVLIADSELGNPLSAPLVDALVAEEELYDTTTGSKGSRIRVTWDTAYPFVSGFHVKLIVGDLVIANAVTRINEYVSPQIEGIVAGAEPVDVLVNVAIETNFLVGEFQTETVAVHGKQSPPSDVPTIQVEHITADTVLVSWGKAVDIDVLRYDLRKGTVSDTFATAERINLCDNLQHTVSGLPLGVTRLFIKAVDTVGNLSMTTTTIDVTTTIPPEVTGLVGFEVGGEVRLSWEIPAVGFIDRYRLTYALSSASDTEIDLDVVEGRTSRRYTTTELPDGDYVIRVYADNIFGQSITAAETNVLVTTDSGSFLLANVGLAADELTNMHEWTLRDGRKYYITNMGESFDATASDSDFALENITLAGYHAPGDARWQSEIHDLGLVVSGSFSAQPEIMELEGTAEVYLEVSTDNVTFQRLDGVRATARYVRVVITSAGDHTVFITPPKVVLNVTVDTTGETGRDTSVASGGKQINLTKGFSAFEGITIQPIGTTALTGVVDNLIVGENASFEVYIFQTNNSQQVATDFLWSVSGV